MTQNLNPIELTYRRLLSQGRQIQRLFSGNPNEQGLHFPVEILHEIYLSSRQFQYYQPHPKGLLVARETVAAYYGEQGISIDPENILITSGTSESFSHLFHYLAQAGDNILAPRPAYPLFEQLADYARVSLRFYSLDEKNAWAIDWESLEAAWNEKSRALLLVSPNNPTGAVASQTEIEKLLQWCERKKIALIADEVFSEFYFKDGKFPRPLACQSPTLVFTLNGISKMFALPALKLSWIVVQGPKPQVDSAVDALETLNDVFLSCHLPLQEGLPQLFKKGGDFLQSYREEVERRCHVAVDALTSSTALDFVEPQGGFYLTARVKNSSDLSEEQWVIRLMEETGVFVHPGYFFDLEAGVHFVLSFLSPQNILKTGLKAIVDFAGNS